MLAAYAAFGPTLTQVNVRVAVSFISIVQARQNLEKEIPDRQTLEETARITRAAWAEKLDRIKLIGATKEQKEIFYTEFFHSLQYPYEQDEYGRYYSGYDDSVHEGVSYTGYSIWSMIQDYNEGGWLPMWKNIIETNIMVTTHADSLIAEAVLKGVTGFHLGAAWNAVYKDAIVPPINDTTTSYGDREEFVDYEVRAGLSSAYKQKGWVADDIHLESASRTLDYSYDDLAVFVLASLPNKTNEQVFFRERAMYNLFTIFNPATGFMEAKNVDSTWAGPDNGWTEGDKWAHTFDVVHSIPGLIERKGGNKSFVEFLDEHFNGDSCNDDGVDFANTLRNSLPTIPYLYSLAGAAAKSQIRIRQIAGSNYNASVNGLSENEDCGQMSAWYLFSALGFYPVNPVSGEYIVGNPFFDKISIDLPLSTKKLDIISPGAPTKPHVCSLTVNGHDAEQPIVRHEQIARGGVLSFEMRETPQAWGNPLAF